MVELAPIANLVYCCKLARYSKAAGQKSLPGTFSAHTWHQSCSESGHFCENLCESTHSWWVLFLVTLAHQPKNKVIHDTTARPSPQYTHQYPVQHDIVVNPAVIITVFSCPVLFLNIEGPLPILIQIGQHGRGGTSRSDVTTSQHLERRWHNESWRDDNQSNMTTSRHVEGRLKRWRKVAQ